MRCRRCRCGARADEASERFPGAARRDTLLQGQGAEAQSTGRDRPLQRARGRRPQTAIERPRLRAPLAPIGPRRMARPGLLLCAAWKKLSDLRAAAAPARAMAAPGRELETLAGIVTSALRNGAAQHSTRRLRQERGLLRRRGQGPKGRGGRTPARRFSLSTRLRSASRPLRVLAHKSVKSPRQEGKQRSRQNRRALGEKGRQWPDGEGAPLEGGPRGRTYSRPGLKGGGRRARVAEGVGVAQHGH